MFDYYNDPFLAHKGVKGMKWGVRKRRRRPQGPRAPAPYQQSFYGRRQPRMIQFDRDASFEDYGRDIIRANKRFQRSARRAAWKGTKSVGKGVGRGAWAIMRAIARREARRTRELF